MPAIPLPSDADPSNAWLESSDGARWPLHGNCHLGRAEENDIFLDHPKASRLHAAIHVQDETEFWLLDLGSRNGTYLNERRLTRPTRLRHGDALSICGRTFAFHQPAGSRSHTVTDHSMTTTGDGATVLDIRQQNAWLLIADIEKFTQLTHEWNADKLAQSMGGWLRDSRRLVAKHHGRIPKYLGDGFLACWEDCADTAAQVVAALGDFQQLRKESQMKFRVAVHYGPITFGGQSELGEESMLGPEMNYVFRLEDLASALGIPFCLSSSAQAQLTNLLSTRSVAGEHKLKGFDHTHRCFSISDSV